MDKKYLRYCFKYLLNCSEKEFAKISGDLLNISIEMREAWLMVTELEND